MVLSRGILAEIILAKVSKKPKKYYTFTKAKAKIKAQNEEQAHANG